MISTLIPLLFFVATGTLFNPLLDMTKPTNTEQYFGMETKHEQCRVLHVEKGRREWVNELVTQVPWGCTGDAQARWILAWLRWEDKLPGPAEEPCICHLQMIWHSAHRVLPEVLSWDSRKWSRLFPPPLQCAGYTCLPLILTLSSTGRSYTRMGNKFPLCSAPLSFTPMAESTA